MELVIKWVGLGIRHAEERRKAICVSKLYFPDSGKLDCSKNGGMFRYIISEVYKCQRKERAMSPISK